MDNEWLVRALLEEELPVISGEVDLDTLPLDAPIKEIEGPAGKTQKFLLVDVQNDFVPYTPSDEDGLQSHLERIRELSKHVEVIPPFYRHW